MAQPPNFPTPPPAPATIATDDDLDLEYHSDDDAWYNVKVTLQGHNLTITYSMLAGPLEQEVHDATKFNSVQEVNAFRNRFRPTSKPVEDHECCKIVPGMKVCAPFMACNDDLRYYDAVVEQVDGKDHPLKEGVECLCSFILCWLHGPAVGDLTTASTGDVCLLTDGEIDQTLVEFIKLALTMVRGSSVHSGSLQLAAGSGNQREFQAVSEVHASQNNQHTVCDQLQLTSQQSEVSSEFLNPDMDVGGIDMALTKFLSGKSHFAVVVDNLDKDLTPSTLTKFIHKETNIHAEAHILPSLLTYMYTSGVVEVHTREDFIELCNFLESPHQIIVSSRNRPLVVTAKFFSQDEVSTLMSSLGNPVKHNAGSGSGLKVVQSGSPEYKIARQLKDTFVEFHCHQKSMLERLAHEEQRIKSKHLTS